MLADEPLICQRENTAVEQANRSFFIKDFFSPSFPIHVFFLFEFLNVIVHCSTGGTNIRAEKKALKASPHIVVGTPGRVLDMMSKGFLKTDGLSMFCLDEADEMLGRGF